MNYDLTDNRRPSYFLQNKHWHLLIILYLLLI